MCGIIGYLGDADAAPILHTGLQNLEYRGYDSAGIALGNGQLSVTKQAGEVDTLDIPASNGSTYGIGHTRWSTHGKPIDRNAHPHLDCTRELAVVHNGIISNHNALRDELQDHHFESDTDTEVIPHLLEEAYAETPSLREAVETVVDQLEGSFAFCVIHQDEERLVATRHGSPLVVGHTEHGGFVASDVPAFLEHTRQVTFLNDGDLVTIDRSSIKVFTDGASRFPEPETVEWNAESAEKGGYEHYMRKEIHEQSHALRQAISDRIDWSNGDVTLDLPSLEDQLHDIERVHLIGAGTSHYAAQYGSLLLERFSGVSATAHIASEYRLGPNVDPDSTLVIGVTQSGETKDTLDAMQTAQAAGVPTLAITNVMGSSVTRLADETLFLQAGPEIAVASTKAFSSQVLVLALVGIRLGRIRDQISASKSRELFEDLTAVPGAVQQALDHESAVATVADEFAASTAYFFIGRDLGLPVAAEGALKLKEISYVHAEAFPAGELKHGPLALVDSTTPVFAILTDGASPAATLHNVREAQTRDAPVIAIASEAHGQHADTHFPVPTVGLFEPLIANVYLQLFAYHTARILDRPIDKPRNLAKSVTVD